MQLERETQEESSQLGTDRTLGRERSDAEARRERKRSDKVRASRGRRVSRVTGLRSCRAGVGRVDHLHWGVTLVADVAAEAR